MEKFREAMKARREKSGAKKSDKKSGDKSKRRGFAFGRGSLSRYPGFRGSSFGRRSSSRSRSKPRTRSSKSAAEQKLDRLAKQIEALRKELRKK